MLYIQNVLAFFKFKPITLLFTISKSREIKKTRNFNLRVLLPYSFFENAVTIFIQCQISFNVPRVLFTRENPTRYLNLFFGLFFLLPHLAIKYRKVCIIPLDLDRRKTTMDPKTILMLISGDRQEMGKKKFSNSKFYFILTILVHEIMISTYIKHDSKVVDDLIMIMVLISLVKKYIT